MPHLLLVHHALPPPRQGSQAIIGKSRGENCHYRHYRRQCKIFASGVNFSIFTHFLCFFLLKLLKSGEIDGVKFLAWKSGGVKFWTNSMSGSKHIMWLTMRYRHKMCLTMCSTHKMCHTMCYVPYYVICVPHTIRVTVCYRHNMCISMCFTHNICAILCVPHTICVLLCAPHTRCVLLCTPHTHIGFWREGHLPGPRTCYPHDADNLVWPVFCDIINTSQIYIFTFFWLWQNIICSLMLRSQSYQIFNVNEQCKMLAINLGCVA